MVTRKTSSGDILYAREGVTPLEAIKAYTIDGAYSAMEEKIKGSIEQGKLADFIVVDKDPLNIPHDMLKDIKVIMTVLGGEIVFTEMKED
jgi:hypothetical protein